MGIDTRSDTEILREEARLQGKEDREERASKAIQAEIARTNPTYEKRRELIFRIRKSFGLGMFEE